MKKAVLVFVITLLLIVISVPGGFFLTSVYAIPSKTLHDHTTKSVAWSPPGSPIPPNDPQKTVHNHYSNQSFGGNGTLNREPYNACQECGVWDDDQAIESWPDTDFVVGHGFIDKSHSIPKYYFNGTWDANARDMVDMAFIEWSSIESLKPNLITGIAFEQTTKEADAKIILVWQPIDDFGLTYWPSAVPDVGDPPHPAPDDVAVIFDSDPGNGGWYFPKDPSGCPNTSYHFYSVALHEVGHVVGLDHQADTDDIMYGGTLPPGSAGDGIRADIDDDSKWGARDLYSIPAPDFGDAPDPKYPSLLKTWMLSTAARHFDFTFEWLGDDVNGEIDSKQVDRDQFDDGWLNYPSTNPLTVRISTTGQAGRYAGATGHPLYLNIWFDRNANGVWEPGEREIWWEGGPGFTTAISPNWQRQFYAGNDIELDFDVPPLGAAWVRFRLDWAENTAGPGAIANIDPTLDGPKGAAQFGEVEDYHKRPYGCPVFPNWYAMMAAVVAAGGLGYLTSRRLLKRA